EPKPLVVEPLRFVEIAHIEVHMTDCRARRRAGPRLTSSRGDDAVDVERFGGHRQLAVGFAPRGARTVGVNLDPETVWIGEVQRFADEMIGHPRANAELA